jgi:hypothetical protein
MLSYYYFYLKQIILPVAICNPPKANRLIRLSLGQTKKNILLSFTATIYFFTNQIFYLLIVRNFGLYIKLRCATRNMNLFIKIFSSLSSMFHSPSAKRYSIIKQNVKCGLQNLCLRVARAH